MTVVERRGSGQVGDEEHALDDAAARRNLLMANCASIVAPAPKTCICGAAVTGGDLGEKAVSAPGLPQARLDACSFRS